MKSQNALILAHLKRGKHLTAIKALEMFGCFRLASRINDLRNMGHSIVTVKTKTNSGKWIGVYRMAK
jgi:hypothetical protein